MAPEGSTTVLTVGSISEDIFAFVSRFPVPGETLLGSGNALRLGGKGANQAVAASMAGASSRIIGSVGTDEQGTRLLEQLAHAGVDTSLVGRTSCAQSGTAHISVDDSGENCIIVVPGANAELDAGMIQDRIDDVRDAEIVVTQAEIPTSTICELLRVCREEGTPCVLNLAPYVTLPPETVKDAVWIVVNEVEFSELSGTPIDTPTGDALRLMADSLPCEKLVVTLGAEGAILAERGREPVHVPSPDLGPVIDTTGAGDAFVGIFATALAFGMTPEDAVHWAVRGGADVVLRRGATSSYRDFTRLRTGVDDE